MTTLGYDVIASDKDSEGYKPKHFLDNYQYYQLGGFPSPRELWPFLNWTMETNSSNRYFIQIRNETNSIKFGTKYLSDFMTRLESAFEFEFIPAPEPEMDLVNLKPQENGTHNLALRLTSLPEMAPKSRGFTIWRLDKN